MAQIPITGLPSSHLTPGVYGEILFNQGPSSAGVDPRQVVFLGPMLASGATWTALTRYRVKTEADAKTGAGAGSPIHRAIRRFLRNNKTAEVYAVPYAATSGSTDVPADLDITWATDPTGTGVTEVTICGETISVGFDDSDTVTTIATNAKNAINAKDHLPVTASNASGVLTLTAKVDGTSQGDGTVGVIRVRGSIDSGVGTTITVEAAALGLGTATAGAEGTTTEEAGLIAALATMTNDRKYYICITDWDAEALAAATAHVDDKSVPKPGLRSVIISGYTGTLTAAASLAITENNERLAIVAQKNSEGDVADLVGNFAAIVQKWETRDATFNFNGYNGFNQIEGYNVERDWEIPAAYATSDWPTDDEQSDAISDGVTPIASRDGGSYIVKATTTRSKDSSGTNDDARSRSRHIVSGGDYAMDDLLATLASRFGSKKLKADTLLANGQVDPNQELAPRVVTPSTVAPTIVQWAERMENEGIFDSAQEVVDSLLMNIDPDNGGRIEFGLDYTTIALLDQITVRAAENTPG